MAGGIHLRGLNQGNFMAALKHFFAAGPLHYRHFQLMVTGGLALQADGIQPVGQARCPGLPTVYHANQIIGGQSFFCLSKITENQAGILQRDTVEQRLPGYQSRPHLLNQYL